MFTMLIMFIHVGAMNKAVYIAFSVFLLTYLGQQKIQKYDHHINSEGGAVIRY